MYRIGCSNGVPPDEIDRCIEDVRRHRVEREVGLGIVCKPIEKPLVILPSRNSATKQLRNDLTVPELP